MKTILHFLKIIFRSIWHIIISIMLLLLGFHFWFIYHSERTIEDLITWSSNGKLTAEIHHFKIDYLHNNIDIRDLIIFNTDSSAQSTSYRFSVQKFHLKIRSTWDLIFHRQLLIDSIVFNYPDITVTRRGPDTAKTKLLPAQELGRVYKAISQSLTVLNLHRFEINEGKVLLKDGSNVPFALSHIFLTIDKLHIDSASEKETGKFIFSDRILLRIADQNILLPDNKSSVAFKELLIDSKEKFIRITGPSINIPISNQHTNSFIASALRVDITGLDFNALYEQQLIKADSVSITDLSGRADLYLNKQNKRKTPLDSVLHHLPVAVDIRHIVMQNGDALAYLHRAGKTTSFKTQKDNISIVGLRINDSLENFLNIDGFHYTIRNYIGHTPDSIYSFQFDSLQFIDNKIVLHHFTVTTIRKTKASLIRNYTVPRFEITGMDWFSFIFDNHFRAETALLYNPDLNIEKNDFPKGLHTIPAGNNTNVYQALSLMDNLLDLDHLQIINGNFSFKEKPALSLQLRRLNLEVDVNELTKAKSFGQISHSVRQLSFDTATATNSRISLYIGRSDFNNQTGNLLLDKVILNAANNGINARLTGLGVSDFSFDDNELEVNGLSWEEAAIHITGQDGALKQDGTPAKENKTPALILKGIAGNNTSVSFENKNGSAALFLKTFSAQNLLKKPDDPFHLEGLSAAGNDLKLDLSGNKLRCQEFIIRDKQISVLQNSTFEQRTPGGDTLSVSASLIHFTPSLNEFIETGAIAVTDLSIDDASIRALIIHKNNKILLTCAPISLNVKSIGRRKDHTLLADHLSFHTNRISFVKNDSVTLNTFGNTNLTISNFLYHPSTRDWNVQLGQFMSDSIQYSTQRQNRLTLVRLKVERLNAANTDLRDPLPWLINQSGADIASDFVHWQNNNTNLQVSGFRFDQPKKQVTIHSLSLDPGKSRDDFTKDLVYRKDYIQVASGPMCMDGIEMKDSLLQIQHISMDDPSLNVYGDKLKKPGAETLKPLPVKALQGLPLALRVNKVQLNNMAVRYTELNAGTRRTGSVYFTGICGEVSNITSRPDPATDSLQVNVRAKFLDTMRVHVEMRESYTDPLSGIRLQVEAGQGNLYLLNPFLAPLVSIRVRSGYLDTMSMTAVGNEYLSGGKMRLYYHSLKGDLLDSGNTQRRRFGTVLLTFLANTLAIKNRNNRQADFYFVRIRDNSAINYFLKMVVAGASGSVAPLSKIIARKQYRKDIKNLAVPAPPGGPNLHQNP